ncbi:unnamed protein product [Prorocentrum cordatum]|uniref:Uncharacterized protein n=1 Tax=Prorocentrum cordatum TaxID=2364126 RepID=A0ABN9WWY3_9DINO|nr:unnamed protein product [Polarella glacialis]
MTTFPRLLALWRPRATGRLGRQGASDPSRWLGARPSAPQPSRWRGAGRVAGGAAGASGGSQQRQRLSKKKRKIQTSHRDETARPPLLSARACWPVRYRGAPGWLARWCCCLSVAASETRGWGCGDVCRSIRGDGSTALPRSSRLGSTASRGTLPGQRRYAARLSRGVAAILRGLVLLLFEAA